MITPGLILSIILGYFLVLLLVSRLTTRQIDSAGFFVGNRKSPWFIIAFGMLGASLSGVTFISVPGWVIDTKFTYLQMVMGYLLGYITIAYVLLPIYYRLNLTSIYTYLDQRFGLSAYQTGAWFFLISRVIGASFRLYIVADVLQLVIFDAWGIPFWATVLISILFIWLYTFRGGIKTIIWTDFLQTSMMLSALAATIVILSRQMGLSSAGDLIHTIQESEFSQVFVFDDWHNRQHFFKQFLSGMLITLVMTGLDQDMMQKNLSCRNLRDAQKNMLTYGLAFLPFNLLFLSLGVLLVLFSQTNGIALPTDTDHLYPLLAQTHLGGIVFVMFILGLTASAYSSADSALTALTTSFTVDILRKEKLEEKALKRTRIRVHIGMSITLAIVILIFSAFKDRSVVDSIFSIASYTYGPLLGLFAFGIITTNKPRTKWIPFVAIISPVIAHFIKLAASNIWGWQMAYEFLLLNGGICFLGLLLLSYGNGKTVKI
jgi:solute:Na+ symporter, SSS family